MPLTEAFLSRYRTRNVRSAAVLLAFVISACGRSPRAAPPRSTPLPHVAPAPSSPPPPAAAAPAAHARGCPADERRDRQGACWPARTTRAEIDAATCSWHVASLRSRLPTRDLDLADVPATVVLSEGRTFARVEAPLRFDAEVREVSLRTVRAVDLAQGTVALAPDAAVTAPRSREAGTLVGSVMLGAGARLSSVTVPCDALAPGAEFHEDEDEVHPERPRGRKVALPPHPFGLRATPDAPPAVQVSTYRRGRRRAFCAQRGRARGRERVCSAGWVRAADLAPPRPAPRLSRRGQLPILSALGSASQSGLMDVLRGGSVSMGSLSGLGLAGAGSSGTGLGTIGTGGAAATGRAADPCLFVPGVEGERRTARVAREAPVLRGRVGRHVWAEIATDDAIDLFVPTEGDRARIVRLPGLVPVRAGRQCPNVFLDAWVPKSALLDIWSPARRAPGFQRPRSEGRPSGAAMVAAGGSGGALVIWARSASICSRARGRIPTESRCAIQRIIEETKSSCT